MATSDKRREVAARLRATKAECDERGYTWMVEDLLQALGFVTYEDEGIFDRLADLIDPTCYVESVDSTGSLLAYRLSCGDTAYVAHPALRPSYCPICGARVVH